MKKVGYLFAQKWIPIYSLIKFYHGAVMEDTFLIVDLLSVMITNMMFT
jgi:hypothetical protein